MNYFHYRNGTQIKTRVFLVKFDFAITSADRGRGALPKVTLVTVTAKTKRETDHMQIKDDQRAFLSHHLELCAIQTQVFFNGSFTPESVGGRCLETTDYL